MYVLALPAVLALLPAAAVARIDQDFTLTGTGVADSDLYGRVVSVSGNIALVTAPHDDDEGTNAGAGFMYATSDGGSTWTQTAKLTDSGGASQDLFGWSGAEVSGNIAAFGAYKDDAPGVNDGSVTVYTTSDGGLNWTQRDKLTDTSASSNEFGHGLGLDGTILASGAFVDDTKANNAGKVVIFVTADDGLSWTQTAMLTDTSGAAEDRMGLSVAVSGNIVVAGSLNSDVKANNAGAVVVWVTSDGGTSWTQTAKLTDSDGAAEDYLGLSVAIDGDILLAGAFRDDEPGADSGSVSVFVTSDGGTTWAQTAKLSNSDGGRLGQRVGISGNLAVLGAPNGGVSNAGYAVVMETDDGGTTWTEVAKLTGTASLQLGFSVAIDGGIVVAGGTGTSGVVSGAAYVSVFDVGATGDPVLVDFAGHRFLAGNAPHERLMLFQYKHERLVVQTGTVQGRENGYFLGAVTLERVPGDERATIRAVPQIQSSTITGSPNVAMSMARGDNGLVVVSVGNGEAVIAVMPHVSNGFSFLNARVLFATDELKHNCSGLLCGDPEALQR